MKRYGENNPEILKQENDDSGTEAAKKQRRSNYTGFSEYMNFKEDKLKAQFESSVVVKSGIFRGVCIHVNGLTRPPLSVLRNLIIEHGGSFEQYYHRDTVTHFICTHVARAKLENFIKRSNGKIKVMRPEWITDSIEAGKLLDEFNYRNYILFDEKQNNLHQYFGQNSEEVEVEAKVDHFDPEGFNNEKDDSCDIEKDDYSINEDDIDLLAEMIDSVEEVVDEKDVDVISFSESINHDTLDKSPRSKTAAHPEFLNEYYKNSRLHHISTWREELKMYAEQLMSNKKRSVKKVESGRERAVMHVDLDCFFVSVSLLKHPEREALKGQPIAVTHAKNDNFNITDSSADISSCNYEARAFGIKNDMYIKQALKLCPHLRMIPYDFEGYNRASRRFYEILASWADELQAVSCDEAYLDVSDSLGPTDEPDRIAQQIRNEIRRECGIDASIGIGPNMLIARLATRKAKPNGQFQIKQEDVDTFMAYQRLKDLPGFGDALIEKLPAEMKSCSDVLGVPLGDLQNRLGHRQGLNLFRKIRGEDDRQVGLQNDRKSVGSEVSWGVRFSSVGQCKRFLDELAGEVWQRMLEAFPNNPEPKPKRLQIKLYRKQEGAGVAKKHLGRGICDVFHRSKTFAKAPIKVSLFVTDVWNLFESEFLKALSTQIEDIRGIGIFLNDFGCNVKSAHKDITELFQSRPDNSNNSNSKIYITASQIDSDVFAELPEDIRAEYEHQFGINNFNAKVDVKKKPAVKASAKVMPSKTLTQMWGHREERESAQLLQGINDLPSDQFDREVVLALPRELQIEIVNQWKLEVKRVNEIRLGDSNLVKIDRSEKPIDPASVIKIVEKLPISFLNRSDWTCQSLYASILHRQQSSNVTNCDIKILLTDLVLNGCLKMVSELCAFLKSDSDFEEILENLKKLVAELNEGSELKF